MDLMISFLKSFIQLEKKKVGSSLFWREMSDPSDSFFSLSPNYLSHHRQPARTRCSQWARNLSEPLITGFSRLSERTVHQASHSPCGGCWDGQCEAWGEAVVTTWRGLFQSPLHPFWFNPPYHSMRKALSTPLLKMERLRYRAVKCLAQITEGTKSQLKLSDLRVLALNH